MKKFILVTTTLILASSITFAQETKSEEAMEKRSWLKFGVNLGVPVGNASNASSFAAGVELKAQFMQTEHFGLGLGTGYTNYFPKSGATNFGVVPAALFLRVYPASKGFFAGTDIGYGFVTYSGAKGGFYLKPQLGYHNYSWNVFAYYDNVFRSTVDGGDIGNVGIGATYNIRFK